MIRLRIGHIRLTHRYPIERIYPPKCNSCNTQLTVKHIIGECCLYNGARRRKFQASDSFEEIMSENENFNPEEIFDYMREIGLLGQI